jgi:uncharacterized membrane protein YdjX (TVP38/TMEM64 family)
MQLLNKKRVVLFSWLFLVLAVTVWCWLNPQYLTQEYWHDALEGTGIIAWVIFAAILLIRGFFLIPSTPFVIAAGIIFQDQSIVAFTVALSCIIISGVMIYGFSEWLGFDSYFKEKYPKQIQRLQNVLSRFGTPIVATWSFTPVVPTDLICYVAGTLKMPFWQFILGLVIGEGILVALCIFGSQEILGFFA